MIDRFPNIAAIGIELEGGWNENPCSCHRMVSDGSVRVPSANIVGEIPIGPFTSWRLASDSIVQHYPDTVNRTCGLHVHLSFPTPGHYSAIMSERFEAFLHRRLLAYGRLKRFARDGAFMSRLRGDNSYCSTRYSDRTAQIQATSHHKGSERYAFLNYCYGLHTTVELRALPAFRLPSAAVKAIEYVCQSFERYLSLPNALRPDPYAETFAGDVPDAVEDFTSDAGGGFSEDLYAEVG